MIHPKSTPPTVQLILYQNIEKWKDPISQLSDGKISKIEFKRFVMEQFEQLESEFVHLIQMNSEKKIDAQKILDDNLKTKAMVVTLLEYPGFEDLFSGKTSVSLIESLKAEVSQS